MIRRYIAWRNRNAHDKTHRSHVTSFEEPMRMRVGPAWPTTIDGSTMAACYFRGTPKGRAGDDIASRRSRRYGTSLGHVRCWAGDIGRGEPAIRSSMDWPRFLGPPRELP
jgi:hypothetical protein